MLPAQHRLRSSRSIETLFRKGIVKSNDFFTIRFFPPRAEIPFRATVVTSAKLEKRAVVRNLLRRRITEMLRLEKESLAPTDLVLIPKPLALSADFATLRSKLFSLLTFSQLFRS